MFSKGAANMSKPKVTYYKNSFGVEYMYSNTLKFSYSEHSHISVFTISIVLNSSIKLKKE